MQANLVLHRGAIEVSPEVLSTVQTPERTSSWVPVPHDRLVEQVRIGLAGCGFEIAAEKHGLAHDGLRYFGVLQVVRPGGNGKDYCRIAGIRNSHDKSFPAALAFGAQVFVCDNLSFSGEVTLSRKHTVWIERDLPQLVARAIGIVSTSWENQDKRFELYKRFELTSSQVNDVLVQSLDLQVIGATYIPDILKEYRHPRHQEFEADGHTAWRLYNAYTEIMKDVNAFSLPKRSQALTGLMDRFAGFEA